MSKDYVKMMPMLLKLYSDEWMMTMYLPRLYTYFQTQPPLPTAAFSLYL